MVNEKQRGIVRREWLMIFFGFHKFRPFVFRWLVRFSVNGHCALYLREKCDGNILLVGLPYRLGILARMELRHLRYFVAVAEEENVTRAALRLHVSQPPLSRQIRNLEDELGIALFDHEAKAVRLTEAGRVFLTEARLILQRAERVVQMAKDVAGGKRGEIHIGYAPSLTVELLPRALRYFRKSNPGVRAQLHDLSTQEMLRGLRDGKLRAALMVQVPPKTLAGLVFEELQRLAVCVAVHRAHPLARARRVGLEQVAKEHLIAFTLADYPEHQAWIAGLFAPVNRTLQFVEEHDSFTSLIAAVESGRGIAVIAQPLKGF